VFKQLTLYTLDPQPLPSLEAMEQALAAMPFLPCMASQEHSIGWVPPRGKANGALVEVVNGQRLLRLQSESKRVPGAVVQRHLDERLEQIEAREGRQPGRREQRQLRDEIVQQLLPMAFAQSRSVCLWIDPAHGRLALDSSSSARCDEAISTLLKSFTFLQPRPWNTQMAPQAAMTAWLSGSADDWPPHFAPGQEVELKANDEQKSVVKFTRHPLDDEQMRLHIGQGKLPTKLALDWEGRVRFVLAESGSLSKIEFLEGVFAEHGHAEEEGGFDADATIATAELSALINDLGTALGGLQA